MLLGQYVSGKQPSLKGPKRGNRVESPSSNAVQEKIDGSALTPAA